ncbi:hypothetical protein DH2020_019325 [Rehmannia glutinosa]|uniref:Cytochrome P450 n=1 Tax=Rehmannia glutinosa TaxID=99300 RepID=A0ABR0WNF8_REHGL
MEEFQLFAFLVALIVLFCGLYFTRNKLTSRGNIKLAPSPPTLPVIGNLHQLGHLPHRSLWELSTKYGPIMLLKFGSKPTLVISSAAIAKEILKTHDLAFANKPVMSAPKKIFYDLKDLVNLQYGEQWRKIRSIFVHELLSSTRVKSFNTIREEEIDLMHSETGHGKIFLDKMDDAVALLFNFTIGEFVPWLGWINRLNGFNACLDKYARELDEVLNAVIEDHMSRGTSSNGDEDDGKSKENFVDILLGIYKGNTPGVSIDLISLKAVILDALGAGTETSTTTLIWLIPFGAGRRICPGLGFAAISIEHTVANLMQKFDWALPHGAKGEDLDATERPGFTIGKKEPLIVVPTKSYF